MTSMRKLRRQLRRWQRYDIRAAKLVPMLVDRGLRRGHYLAAAAVESERYRRTVRDVYWPLDRHLDGWAIHQPGDGLEDRDEDEYGCGDPTCPGDCETCWAEESDDDLPQWLPDVVTVHAFSEQGLL